MDKNSSNIIDLSSRVLEHRIAVVKDFLDAVKNAPWSVSYDPVPSFTDKHNFPKDYQLFTENIGILSIGSGTCGIGDEIAILDAATPESCDDLNNINVLSGYEFWIEPSQVSKWADHPIEDIVFVGSEPCASQAFAYLKKNRPYKFVSDECVYEISGEMEFIDWIEYALIENFSYYRETNKELAAFRTLKNVAIRHNKQIAFQNR